MLTRSVLPRLAHELGLRFKEPLRGGTFGAAVVVDRDGQEFVLKADPTGAWTSRFARGAALAERLRLRGYPAPLHIATGVASGASWSLQERLRGVVPGVMTAQHAVRLLELVRRHARAAGSPGGWIDHALPEMRAAAERLELLPHTRRIAGELREVIERSAGVELRDGDVVHDDFSHRNYLAIGDEVTGVIDWELAEVGDWRLDLMTLAYWAAVEPARAERDAAQLVITDAATACPPPVRALFLGHLALRHLDLDARLRPRAVPKLTRAIETNVAGWWRSDMRAA